MILLVALELCARDLARHSLFWSPGLLALIVIAGVAAIAGVATARSSRDRTAIVLAGLMTAGIAVQMQLGARLQSDGFYYFAYLRSLAFDRDVDFTNDYRLLGLGDKPHLFQPTPTGYAQSAWTIGPAIVWSPFFGVGHLVARRLSATNPDVSADGTSFPYRQAICLAGLFYGVLGAWFCSRIAARFYPANLAAAAAAAAVAGSFMLWYIVREPTMTHAPSMAAVAGFVWLWLATRDQRSPRQWALLGLLAGFMGLIRWQNVLFAILPAIDVLVVLARARRGPARAGLAPPAAVRATLVGAGLFAVCAVLGFLPQMIAWRSIYGSWLAVSPLGPAIRFADPQLIDILWSSRNGLFSWSPVLYAGALGLLAFAASRPAVGLPALVAVALMTYFNACIQDWWGSAGYGGRRFDGTIPFFTIGIAASVTAAAAYTARHPMRVVGAAGALLVLFNLTLMRAAQDGVVRIGEALSFGDAFAAQARAFHRWFGNPFTYPASLAFAWRNGLPPARYDLLGANRFLGDPLRPYGRIDIGADDEWLIEEGWHGPERDGAATFRWAASPAVAFVPLDHPAALAIQVRVHAFAFPGAPAQTMTLTLNGRRLDPVAIHEAWETVEIQTSADMWHAGVNRLRLDFAWTRRPMDVGVGNDPRPLSAAVDYLRVQQR